MIACACGASFHAACARTSGRGACPGCGGVLPPPEPVRPSGRHGPVPGRPSPWGRVVLYLLPVLLALGGGGVYYLLEVRPGDLARDAARAEATRALEAFAADVSSGEAAPPQELDFLADAVWIEAIAVDLDSLRSAHGSVLFRLDADGERYPCRVTLHRDAEAWRVTGLATGTDPRTVRRGAGR